MKIVIDTNVFVSSFLNPSGSPRAIIDLWKNGQLTLCICAEILSEYIRIYGENHVLLFGLVALTVARFAPEGIAGLLTKRWGRKGES